MRRHAVVPSQDRSCDDKRINYKSKVDYERFLKGQIQRNIDGISGYTGEQIEVLKNSRDPLQNASYNQALENLQLAESTLTSTIQCINKDIIQRNDYSSRIYSLQQEIEEKRKEAAEKKTAVAEAKERSSLVQNPYSNTTWWETWFPLGRPIRKENVPVLLSVSILMLVFALGIFLRFAGLELRLDSLQTTATNFVKSVNSRKYP